MGCQYPSRDFGTAQELLKPCQGPGPVADPFSAGPLGKVLPSSGTMKGDRASWLTGLKAGVPRRILPRSGQAPRHRQSYDTAELGAPLQGTSANSR